MTVLEIILLCLLGTSVLGNITQFIFGVKIENNQTQIVQTYSMNVNENNNLNIVNTTMVWTNASVVAVVTNGVTNFRVVFGSLSTNVKARITEAWAVTNQSNRTKIGLVPR